MALTALTLIAIACLHMTLVIPVFENMMGGMGASFSAPAIFALKVARYCVVLLVLLAVGLGPAATAAPTQTP